MPEALEFEVRPIEGVFVAIGEEVTFREEDGKLLALNEDGEAFGTVPGTFATQLREMGLEGLQARVTARSDGVPTVAVDGSAEAAAETANAADASTADAVAAQQPGIPQDATQQQPGAPTNNAGQSYEQFLAGGTSSENAEGAQAQEKPKKKKGKRIAIAVLLVVALLFVGCVALLAVPTDDSASNNNGSTSEEANGAMQTVSNSTVSFEVPSTWAVEEDGDTTKTGASDGSTLIAFSSDTALYGTETANELSADVIDGMTDGSTEIDEDSLEENVTDDGVIIRSYDMRLTDEDGIEKSGSLEIVFSGSVLTMVIAWSTADADATDVSALELALDDMVIENPSEPDLAEGKLEPEIVESGYSVDEDGYVSYGIEWQNPNENYAIQSPELTITGRDANGKITFTDSQYMESLAPGETQYFGGFSFGAEGTATVEFGVSQLDDYNFVKSEEETTEYFTISNTDVVQDEYGNTSFTGEITTTADIGDATEARVSVILRDEEGAIVFGDYTYADIGTEGETTAFEIATISDPPDYASYEIYAIPW